MSKKYLSPAIAALAVAMVTAPVAAQTAQFPTAPADWAEGAVIEAPAAELDAVQGGYWTLVIRGGKAAIAYCKANKATCAMGAVKVFDTYNTALNYARSKGWIK